jgi:hypothetical protein
MIANDFIKWLQSKGFGVIGDDLFDTFQPSSPDNCITAFDVDSPGLSESSSLKVDMCGLEIIVRNSSTANGKEIAKNIHKAFMGFGGESLIPGGDTISMIFIDQSPRGMGKDDKGRSEFTVVYDCRVQSRGDTYRL